MKKILYLFMCILTSCVSPVDEVIIENNVFKVASEKIEVKEALFVRIKDGDLEAREEFIKGNLRLVLSVIKRFSSSNENVDDLFQIGCIGLIKAIDNFDTTLNVRFSTYAVPMALGC